MQDYLFKNQQAYDTTAQEFQTKKTLRTASTVRVVDTFLQALAQQHPGVKEFRILELGPGSGHAAHLMTERGHDVTAIEISEPMAKLAQQTAPRVTMIVDEFLAHDFGNETFDGIFALAFVHLFPAADAAKVLEKMYNLLRPDGVLFAGTTKHDQVQEGYEKKTNFNSPEERYRRRYTKSELLRVIEAPGFRVLRCEDQPDGEVPGKVWMEVVALKT
jgi:SAM-dependent methyltransferase